MSPRSRSGSIKTGNSLLGIQWHDMKRIILVVVGIIIGLLALLLTYAAESNAQSIAHAFTTL